MHFVCHTYAVNGGTVESDLKDHFRSAKIGLNNRLVSLLFATK